ncbi:MAG: Hpt domain-containing protein [Burkholderiaceae bacterium]
MMLPSSTPTPLSEPPAGLLDAEALDRLRALDPQGQSGLLPRVLATYTASLRRLLEQLQVARANADVQGQRHVAHTLKSSSASVGALKLSALCADIERRMRDEPTLPVQLQFDAVTIEAEHLLQQLRG